MTSTYISRPERSVLARGAATGLIGAVVVAAWFFLLDIAAGRALFTPAALGSALFLQAQSISEVRMTAGVIAGYTALHITLFMGAGLLFVAAADYLERRPSRVLLLFLSAIVLEGLVIAVLSSQAEWVLGAIGIWAITVANILAIVSMSWWAWRTHPRLTQRLPRTPQDV
jgi:hypothetical protein